MEMETCPHPPPGLVLAGQEVQAGSGDDYFMRGSCSPHTVCGLLLAGLQPPVWGEGIFVGCGCSLVCRALQGYV